MRHVSYDPENSPTTHSPKKFHNSDNERHPETASGAASGLGASGLSIVASTLKCKYHQVACPASSKTSTRLISPTWVKLQALITRVTE